MSLHDRLRRLESQHGQLMVEVWTADPVDPTWSACLPTGERVPSAELVRRGVIEVSLDLAIDRRPEAVAPRWPCAWPRWSGVVSPDPPSVRRRRSTQPACGNCWDGCSPPDRRTATRSSAPTGRPRDRYRPRTAAPVSASCGGWMHWLNDGGNDRNTTRDEDTAHMEGEDHHDTRPGRPVARTCLCPAARTCLSGGSARPAEPAQFRAGTGRHSRGGHPLRAATANRGRRSGGSGA